MRIHTHVYRYDARGVDTWCAGVCLFAMVTGNMPFRASSDEATLDAVRKTEPFFSSLESDLLTVSGEQEGKTWLA